MKRQTVKHSTAVHNENARKSWFHRTNDDMLSLPVLEENGGLAKDTFCWWSVSRRDYEELPRIGRL